MRGWNTQHQEFTPASGDPTIIKQLITKFKINDIVSFDEANSLITTTIKHDQHIRLSDLITLNVFIQSKQISKVIYFSSLQCIWLIRQLFELLEKMKQSQISHGNISTQNILLELSSSSLKLDKKPAKITFQLKLINFSQFYNQQPVDDFDRAYSIYSKIVSLVEIYNKKALLWNKNNLQQNFKQFMESLNNLLDDQKFAKCQDNSKYSWNSKFISTFNSKYTKNMAFLNPWPWPQLYTLISQLHQYHLIVNHYEQLTSLYNYFNTFNYANQPQNLKQACLQYIEIFDTIQQTFTINQQNLKELVEEQSLNNAIDKYRFTVQQEIIIFLQKHGYLENIQEFIQFSNDFDQINSHIFTAFLNEIIDNSKLNIKSGKYPNDILKTYLKSSMMLKSIVFADIFDQNLICNVEIAKKRKNSIIQSLENIQEIGYNLSKLLIDHCMTGILANQLKLKRPDIDTLIQIMVDNWLIWIDKHIFDKKFSRLDQLQKIDKEIFKQFIEDKGFQVLKQSLEQQIKNIVDGIFKNIRK